MKWQNGDPLTAAALNQPHNGLEGTYVESGWSINIGESGAAIELEVDAGSGYLENEQIETTEDVIELSPGDSDYPRRDLIYVAADESIGVLEGFPRPFSEDRNGNVLGFEEAPVPEPDDGSALTGIPLYYVGVPAGAEDTSDLNANALEDIRTFVSIAGTGTLSDSRYTPIGPRDLQDGDTVDIPIVVGDGDTLIVKEWGVQVADSTGMNDPPAGVSVSLIDYQNTVIEREETPFTRNVDGIVEVEAVGSEMGEPPYFYMLRLENDSGQDFTGLEDGFGGEGLYAQFRFEVIYG